MKNLFSFFVLSFCILNLTAQSAGLWEAGNEAYKRGDYPNAIEAYNHILNEGYESADLYYNLGNAYYRTEQFGQAILNYERALRLKPNFSEARQNLQLANAHTEDNITPLPEFFLSRWWHSLTHLFSFTTWLVILLVVATLALLAGMLFKFHPSYRWRKASLVTLAVLSILLLLVVCCAFSSHHSLNRRDRAVVTQPVVVVKSSPDASGVDKLILHDGTTLFIDETLDNWHKIHLADGNAGWLHSDDITPFF